MDIFGAVFVPDGKGGIVAKAIHLKTMNCLIRADDEITGKELSLSKSGCLSSRKAFLLVIRGHKEFKNGREN
jgi:hypothetical protein